MHLVVDIDQTIFPLLQAMSTLPGGEDIREEKCISWYSLNDLCRRPVKEMIYEAIQPDIAEKIGSYEHSVAVLHQLAAFDLDIALATHRASQYRDVTEVYLRSQGLDHFPLYVGEDLEKLKLLFSDGLLVDDSPHTIEEAGEKERLITTLAHPYNEEVASAYQIRRGENWLELEEIIKETLSRALDGE